MPRKTDVIPIQDKFLDRRVKMLPCQRERAKQMYENESATINGLARLFKVNKRSIQFLLFPERQKKNLEDREARGGWKQYYVKEEHAKAIKEHRQYKKEILTNPTINDKLI